MTGRNAFYHVRLAILFLLLFQMVCSVPATVYASEKEPKVVRVGWYESAFHNTDEFGRRSGYGYEYQQRIATYTDWVYEYVEGSWSELFEMLVAGEIDLLSDVSYTDERAEKILYSAEEMGSEDYHAFIAPDNTEIRPDDFSTFNGKRVGVNKNSIQEQLFKEWAEKHGITPEIVECTEKTPELIEMLLRGEIDVLVTLDTYGNSADIVPVCKIGSALSYFGINRDRPDLKQDLDTAMSRLLEDNRDFNQQMTEKYNKASAINSFLTIEEKEWVADHGTIRVGYRDDFLPFCYYAENTDTMIGALADFLEFASNCEKNAKLSFTSRPYKTTEDALQALSAGEVDCIFPVNMSTYDGEKLGLLITDPFVATEMYAVVRKADHQGLSPDREMTVAVLKGHPNHETFLMDYFPKWKVLYCDDATSLMKAVASEQADCTLVSNYRINRVSQQCADYRLTTLTTGEAMNLSFATNKEDDCLYSILNKTIHLMPESMVNNSITSYSFQEEKVTFVDFLRDNLPYVVAVAAVIFSVILLLILRNARSEARANKGQQIISKAEHDHLTHLYNRSFFILYANQYYQKHPEKEMDAIVMNIDRFHTVNTANGREYGDEVLRTLGDEIYAFVSETEGIAGRLDGDHFDIYCAHREDYQALLDRFQACLDAMSHGEDICLRMGVMPWQKGLTPEQMFDLAWSACSMVRRDFKTHIMIYDEELREHDEYNHRLLNDLKRAIENRELEVYYQPKYDIQSVPPKLSSAEALVRWHHPQLGLISPVDFIPLFERSGQISVIDNYVWAEAARQIASWRDQFGILLPVSVNLSRVDVFDADLEETLDRLVAENHLDRGDLMLEVTESAYTQNAEHLIRVIRQLREKGYKIEMDDFGTGYSSLSMLSYMPIDVLKMDIGFIRNIEHSERDFHLVQLILDIARYLKVPVIAEGVETEKQLILLRDAGCDLVQGYYFSKPLSAEEFAARVLN